MSTVDSGNLAGHLLTLANAIEAATTRPLWGSERLNGIADALILATPGAEVSGLARVLAASRRTPHEVPQTIRALADATAPALAQRRSAESGERDWAASTARCILSHARDVEALGAGAPGATAHAQQIPLPPVTLRELAFGDAGADATAAARALLEQLTDLAAAARGLAYEMDFAFLLKPHRMLLSIGYNVTDSRLDAGDYDLLASEARLASFIAIAKRDVPARHWFRLDRHSVAMGNVTALLSWSGSMFEYLMPALVMRAPRGSLLDRALQVAVRTARRWRLARGALGSIRIRVQHPRSRPDLSVLPLWRAGPGFKARLGQ